MTNPERRYLNRPASPIELRAEGGANVITGYASVFYSPDDPGSEYELWAFRGERAVERIMPGAYARAIKEDDVRALFNHEPSMVLGRLAAKTLRLAEDKKGLRYEIDAPDTQAGRDTVISVRRGDVSGSSFAFTPDKATMRYERAADGSDLYIREIESVQLFDVGPVTYPAYQGSTAGLRSRDMEALQAEAKELRHALGIARGCVKLDAAVAIYRKRAVEVLLSQ